MKHRERTLTAAVLAATALMVCFGAWRVRAADTPAREPLSIAVVDWPRLINSLAEWRDNQDSLRQKNQEMERVDREMRRRIDVVKTEMKDLAVGTDERAAKEEELDRLQSELRTKMDLFDRQIKRTIGTYLEDIYRKVITDVNDYAKEHHYDLVVKTQEIDLSQTRMSVRSQIEVSSVLYSSGRADITDALIKILNDKYGKKLEVK